MGRVGRAMKVMTGCPKRSKAGAVNLGHSACLLEHCCMYTIKEECCGEIEAVRAGFRRSAVSLLKAEDIKYIP